ncbi:MAG: hypothetical protein QOI67_2005 [Gaiellaceae bacterium]|jgi:GT2 family glycosyltransferase|nr:hypothetical protein [Gaiellaceae bacterium]
MRSPPIEPHLGQRVTVVVVNWNRWPETLACVEALSRSVGTRFRVIVVDNASDEAAASHALERVQDVEIVQAGANLGYAGGNNLGLSIALDSGDPYVWVLNNDTVPAPDSMAELVKCMEADPRLGVLTSSVLSPDGDWEPGNAIRVAEPRNWSIDRATGQVVCEGCADAQAGHRADIVRGPSLFFRSAALAEVGVFDERYFHYFEEMDLVERLRRAGWGAALACRSRVVHQHGGTLSHLTPQSMYYLHRNQLLFRKKIYGEGVARGLSTDLLRRLRALGAPRYLLRGEFRVTSAQALGIIDAARGRTGQRDLGPRYRRPVELKHRPPHA